MASGARCSGGGKLSDSRAQPVHKAIHSSARVRDRVTNPDCSARPKAEENIGGACFSLPGEHSSPCPSCARMHKAEPYATGPPQTTKAAGVTLRVTQAALERWGVGRISSS